MKDINNDSTKDSNIVISNKSCPAKCKKELAK